MCTAITYYTKDHYFGRNLDLDFSYQEAVTITPRNYSFPFRKAAPIHKHYAIIGMATVDNDYPLYYDAANEHGLCMAGLNFPGNAVYYPESPTQTNITPFELIPWVLAQCTDIPQAIRILKKVNLVRISYSSQYPLTPLHWFAADKTRSITVESTAQGLQIYENPVGVLTNNPPFDYHINNLSNYVNLTSEEPTNHFAPNYPLFPNSRGAGAVGLPGDLSSASRFIKASFTKLNSLKYDSASASISQFFHILGSVAQQEGCVKVGDKYEKTVYSSCCNMDSGIYYYTTYENSQITGVSMRSEDLEGKNLISYPLITGQQIRMEN